MLSHKIHWTLALCSGKKISTIQESPSLDASDIVTPMMCLPMVFFFFLIIPPTNCVCGRVYCFHVVRPTDRPTVGLTFCFLDNFKNH